jgi:hypothetical protein
MLEHRCQPGNQCAAEVMVRCCTRSAYWLVVSIKQILPTMQPVVVTNLLAILCLVACQSGLLSVVDPIAAVLYLCSSCSWDAGQPGADKTPQQRSQQACQITPGLQDCQRPHSAGARGPPASHLPAQQVSARCCATVWMTCPTDRQIGSLIRLALATAQQTQLTVQMLLSLTAQKRGSPSTYSC